MPEPKMPFDKESILKEYDDGTHDTLAKEGRAKFKEQSVFAQQELENAYEELKLAKTFGLDDKVEAGLEKIKGIWIKSAEKLEGPLKLLLDKLFQTAQSSTFIGENEIGQSGVSIKEFSKFLKNKFGEGYTKDKVDNFRAGYDYDTLTLIPGTSFVLYQKSGNDFWLDKADKKLLDIIKRKGEDHKDELTKT